MRFGKGVDKVNQILVTGATGFIGKMLCPALEAHGFRVRRALRSDQADKKSNDIITGNITADTDWTDALQNVDVVVHLAARVHILNDISDNPYESYQEANVEGTRQLATTAANLGIQRFVFLSSIKVNGESTTSRTPFTENDVPQPSDPYGVSKWQAEQCLHEIHSNTALAVTIIRPCLVYGSGVKANFLSMMRWLDKGIPLPLGKTSNQRSMIFVDNLVDLIIATILNERASGETFLASDGQDVSTTDLLRYLGNAMGKPARLIPIPEPLMRIAFQSTGKGNYTDRLLGSLAVDSSKARQLLSWQPPFTLIEGLQRTARWYIEEKDKSS